MTVVVNTERVQQLTKARGMDVYGPGEPATIESILEAAGIHEE